MSTSNETLLLLEGSPIDPTFKGDLQQFFNHMLDRIRVISPFGQVTFVSGSVKPTSNKGPWLKNNVQWYVWDEAAGDYVPLDISASLSDNAWIQDTEPVVFSPPVWIKTTNGGASYDSFWVACNGKWTAVSPTSGPTSGRPGNPSNLQPYYDTDIQAELWFERGAWRTRSGVSGDLKYVIWQTRAEALQRNPGWCILGDPSSPGSFASSAYVGRAPIPATYDNAVGGVASPGWLSDDSVNSMPKLAGYGVGSDYHVLTVEQIPQHYHTVEVVDVQTTVPGGPWGAHQSTDGVSVTKQVNSGFTGGSQAHLSVAASFGCWLMLKL
jgi:hypothetical protein